MILNQHNQNETQGPANSPQLILTMPAKAEPVNFIPSPDEVARQAYFTYVNEGSRNGHEVRHWLAAEAELIAQGNLARIDAFCDRT